MNTLIVQLNQAAIDLPDVLMTWWMTWIKLFDFTVCHISEKRHEIADDLSWWSKWISSNEESQKMNDFIDVQINVIIMTLIMMKKLFLRELETLLLLLKYSENFMQIAHYFNNLQKSAFIIFNEFQKFKSNALCFVIWNQHLFKQMSKNVLLC